MANEQNANYSMAFYHLTGRRYDICRGTARSVSWNFPVKTFPLFCFFKQIMLLGKSQEHMKKTKNKSSVLTKSSGAEEKNVSSNTSTE